MLRVVLNSKRVPKPNGKKKKNRQPANQEPVIETEVLDEAEVLDEPSGPAQPQVNPWAKPKSKKKANKKDIPFVDSFVSSNIDALAYDADKKQMWVRFKGGDVYTYFDVPIRIYRGFWSAPSKGHYFWEKIRKNKHIKYQRLTASLRWIILSEMLSLNSNEQANTASIAKSLKNRVKKHHPEWNVSPTIIKVFNGHRLTFDGFMIDIVRYSNKVRVNIQDFITKKIDFSTTTEKETAKVVDYIMKRVEDKRPVLSASKEFVQLKASLVGNTTVTVSKAALLQLLGYLKESLPEEKWSDDVIDVPGGYQLKSLNYRLTVVADGSEFAISLYDGWSQSTHLYKIASDDFINLTLTYVLCNVLQGTPTV